MSEDRPKRPRRRWRDYRTVAGGRPARDFLFDLSDEDRASVLAAMKDVRRRGLKAARHLRREIYEVRAHGKEVIYRVLFAEEGQHGQVLLALHGYKKKTRKTPPELIELAETRLADWRSRSRPRGKRPRA